MDLNKIKIIVHCIEIKNLAHEHTPSFFFISNRPNLTLPLQIRLVPSRSKPEPYAPLSNATHSCY